MTGGKMAETLTPEEITRSHRWHAIECNNLAWALADKSKRTSQEEEEMLNAAHASAFHWSRVGGELNGARAKMLLGHVHARLGNGSIAMRYARESSDYLLAHEPPDWEVAFVHAILAHAAHAAGDYALFKQEYAQADALGGKVADREDKEIFLMTFKGIPRP
jgi:hypothetical protein